MQVSQEFFGNKVTFAKYGIEQGNMSLFLGNGGTKLYKLGEENVGNKFIKRGTKRRKTCGNMGT